ncbi:hypothetical protein AB6G22_20665 [Providencia hangzhouensis]|uniref:hypothetical protein n=1 Tax=Providencia hangzhouensis TaxID=3031799 RepID=UPI0034DCE93F
MLIVPKNPQIERILDLLSKDSFFMLQDKLKNYNGLLKTPTKISIGSFTFLCLLSKKDIAVVVAFRYKKPIFNHGSLNEISEINMIENYFLDQNKEI